MRWRTVGLVALTALVGLAAPVAVAAVGIGDATAAIAAVLGIHCLRRRGGNDASAT